MAYILLGSEFQRVGQEPMTFCRQRDDRHRYSNICRLYDLVKRFKPGYECFSVAYAAMLQDHVPYAQINLGILRRTGLALGLSRDDSFTRMRQGHGLGQHARPAAIHRTGNPLSPGVGAENAGKWRGW
jgi:hypothetical protein